MSNGKQTLTSKTAFKYIILTFQCEINILKQNIEQRNCNKKKHSSGFVFNLNLLNKKKKKWKKKLNLPFLHTISVLEIPVI